MNEGRKFHVRMELVKRLDSTNPNIYREAERIQNKLYAKQITYGDAERLLGIDGCDESTISRLRGEGL